MARSKDPLGRPNVGSSIEPKPRRALTEGELDAIAAETRTRPPGEVGRHVMPLLQHAAHLRDLLTELAHASETLAFARNDPDWPDAAGEVRDIIARIKAAGVEVPS